MSSGIFLLNKDGTLVEMNQRDYDSEDILQELIANYPNLLAGNLINEENPRQWILISRELSIPDNEASLGRWSLDHLFLDQDGIPTLVEVKRSSDTRIRREVVGQMLEYAANAVSYWDIDKIRVLFETRCENEGLIPEQVFFESLHLEEGYDDFWVNVKTNLEIGKIRMLFIADIIPLELKQIVEFLNEQMTPAEVLALEIKQYVGQSLITLVPRIYGQTSKTQRKKPRSQKPKINKTQFLDALNENGREFIEYFFNKAEEKGYEFNWGTVGFSLNVKVEGKNVAFCLGYPPKDNNEQSVYVDFNLLYRRIKDADNITNEFKERFLKAGFIPAGNDVKWVIVDGVNLEKITTITNLYLELAKAIGNSSLKEID